MQRQHRVRRHHALERCVERSGVETGSGRVGRRQIEDNEIEVFSGCLDEAGGVADHQLDARVAERTPVHFGQVCACEPHDLGVQFGNHDPADFPVPQQLTRGAAIAAAQHQRRARRRMRERGGVNHAFVIDEFIAGRGHRAAIQREKPAELRRVPHLDVLERRIDAHKATCAREAVDRIGRRMKE